MSSIDGEQFITNGLTINGGIAPATAAAVKTSVGAGNAYTFSANYTFSWKGQHYSFAQNKTYPLSADMKAELLARSAPMTAA